MNFNKVISYIRIHLFDIFYNISNFLKMLLPMSFYLFISKIIFFLNSNRGGYRSVSWVNYVSSGIIISIYFIRPLIMVEEDLTKKIRLGLWEAILATPTYPVEILLLSFIWSVSITFVFTLPFSLIYLLWIRWFYIYTINLTILKLILLGSLFFISLAIFFGISLILCGMKIIFEDIRPIKRILVSIFYLFSDIFIPIEVIPFPLKTISYCLPLTYIVKSIRAILFYNYSLTLIVKDILILEMFLIVVLPIGIWFLNFAIKRAKTKGLLTYY